MHLERLIAVLEMTAVAGRPISATEIHKATDLPKATCYRLVQTLLDHRLIDAADESSRFVIGERLIRIALLGKSDIDVRQACAPLIKAAALQSGETAFLARLRNAAVEIIHVETPEDSARAYIHPGLGRRPLHACSCSKAIAAFAEKAFQDAILSGDLLRYTEHTNVTAEDLRAEFDLIVKRGFAECDQEIDIGVASVAAPIMIGSVGAIFSVGAVGPVRRLDARRRETVGEQMKALSAQLSGAIQLCNVAHV